MPKINFYVNAFSYDALCRGKNIRNILDCCDPHLTMVSNSCLVNKGPGFNPHWVLIFFFFLNLVCSGLSVHHHKKLEQY